MVLSLASMNVLHTQYL